MDWIDVLQRFGFPVAMCAIFIFAFYRTSIWLAANVVQPIVRSHLAFMGKLEACMDQNTELLRANTQTNLSIAEQLKDHGDKLDALHRALEKMPNCPDPPPAKPKDGPGWMRP